MENWQLCPKCEGNDTSGYTGMVCRICNGTGLICCFTGMPPARPKSTSQATGNMVFIHGDELTTFTKQ